jgi:hypothetical protein
LRTQLGSKTPPMILVMVTLLLGAVIPAAAGVAPFIMAQQQEEEETSLGEQEKVGLADSIVSDVLDDESVVVVDQDNTAEQLEG